LITQVFERIEISIAKILKICMIENMRTLIEGIAIFKRKKKSVLIGNSFDELKTFLLNQD
jgi:hypothetical protein